MSLTLQFAFTAPSLIERCFLMAGRIAALAIGSLAMYIAFFQYGESAEGRLQNRIEDFWVSVDDRAKETGSLSTALLNRVAAIATGLFERIFGHKLVSRELFIVSLCLSYLPAGLKDGIANHDLFSLDVAAIVTLLAIIVKLNPSEWNVKVIAILAACICLVILAFRQMLTVIPHSHGRNYSFNASMVIVLSFLSDVLTIAVVKWSLRYIAVQDSRNVIFKRILLVTTTMMVTVGVPLYLAAGYTGDGNDINNIRLTAYWLVWLNAATALWCSIPIMIFIVVLCHRALWPLLSRLIFPIARFQLVKNRKAMAAIGSLGILVGLGLKEANVEAILKLFE